MIARRPFWTLALFVILVGCEAAPRPVEPPPNVLFLVVDDLNDWISCLGGHPQAHTPNIDRIAQRGVLFTNAHCQAPICTPSRISMMTGRLPSSTGFYLLSPNNFREHPVFAQCRTLPEYFSANGYHTAGAGKIYHASSARDTFDEYGPPGNFGPLPEQKLNYKTGHKLWDWGEYPAADEAMPDALVADWAISQLARPSEKPLFLAVGFSRPHVPLYVPSRWWHTLPEEADIELPATLSTDRDDLPDYAVRLTHGMPAPRHEWFVQNKQWRRAVRGYLACIHFVDHQVGRVLDALAESPCAENTIIVLCSDHGFHLGEKQRWAKRSLWSRSTRVPLIIAPPGRETAASCDRPVGLIDLYPSFLDLCGLPANDALEGRSLAPLLRDPVARWDRPILTTLYSDNHTLRSRRWRFTRYADGSRELYDLHTDPNEWRNLAGDQRYGGVIEAMSRHLPEHGVDPVPGSSGLGGLIQGVR